MATFSIQQPLAPLSTIVPGPFVLSFTMKFSLALLAVIPAALAAPVLEPRQGGVSVQCGSTTYSSSQVNRAINNALSGNYDSSGYPHTYK